MDLLVFAKLYLKKNNRVKLLTKHLSYSANNQLFKINYTYFVVFLKKFFLL